MSEFNRDLFLSTVWFICGIFTASIAFIGYCIVKQQREINEHQNQMNNIHTNNNRENTNTNRLQNQFIDYVAEIELNSVEETTENTTKTVYSYDVPETAGIIIITDP